MRWVRGCVGVFEEGWGLRAGDEGGVGVYDGGAGGAQVHVGVRHPQHRPQPPPHRLLRRASAILNVNNEMHSIFNKN